ncbi:hypothetical protein FPSE5266_04207 [Fusarium pseudograminearum]|nr:hypothetical protein FPSE5266_04207 [Fusarium pseudograminearum]
MRARSDLLALASSSQPGKSSLNQPFFSPPCDAATHRDSGALVVAVALAGPVQSQGLNFVEVNFSKGSQPAVRCFQALRHGSSDPDPDPDVLTRTQLDD